MPASQKSAAAPGQALVSAEEPLDRDRADVEPEVLTGLAEPEPEVEAEGLELDPELPPEVDSEPELELPGEESSEEDEHPVNANVAASNNRREQPLMTQPLFFSAHVENEATRACAP